MSARLNIVITIKLTMTNIAQIPILSVLVMLISVVGLSVQNAMVLTFTVQDQISYEDPLTSG